MSRTTAKILIVEDDEAIRQLVSRFLIQKNYQVQSAKDGQTALVLFEQYRPDLVILDVNLPDMLGYYLCEQMQSNTGVFILMLTARDDVADKKEGFLKGADDYLTKPFDLQELEYRIHAILKRQRFVSNWEQQPLVFEHLTIDPTRREVIIDEQLVSLTTLEFDLLYLLASCPGRVWRRTELVEQIWSQQDAMEDRRVVDVHIGQLRKKIKSNSQQDNLIQTVRGIGYKFIGTPNSAKESASEC